MSCQRKPYSSLSGNGLAFTVSATTDSLLDALPSQYMGMFSIANDGNATNQLFAVELDTILNPEFRDINSNHVGIDVNSLTSISSNPAGYYTPDGSFSSLRLISGEPMQVWVDYDDSSHRVNVSLAPYLQPKPQRPLLSTTVNLTSLLPSSVYVGFASATSVLRSIHRIIGWSFNPKGDAKPLNYTALSEVIQDVRRDNQRSHSRIPMKILIPVVTLSVFVTLVIIVALYVNMKKAREIGEWEIDSGSSSFTYKDLATSGFSDRMLLGKGGFGKVYKGVLQTSKQNVAIKRVSPESKQGMKEFIAEITILGHLRHRNLVQLLGYSRHKSELLLVYDYMSNGSLDRVLHGQDRQQTVDWVCRFNIIRGIASGLCYLHEDWEKVVIHRDIKTSNVLLDNEMNGRLGDFGLARLHNHGTDAHTTHLAGTWGYIAPELARLGRATKATDVFAFGVFMLEVACGRRPIEVNDSGEPVLLTDWVTDAWESGSILRSVDPRLEDYVREEAELVLKLGLLCSHPVPSARPSTRLIVQYLVNDVLLPDFQPSFLSLTSRDEDFDQHILTCPSVVTTMTGLSGGR
ncbi:L-type lectin-domain containing receptor kinase SIT2-like [Lolium perenne]|uniref:L-type lectin-domain containing receptor kinase SIT2-like n=1 Tax=Lolium perenne TaxID=4522 RepID=UPI0021EA043C|nr:L-type lectin-domain containing receptor kinase SIT2-like [Lolium perenne]